MSIFVTSRKTIVPFCAHGGSGPAISRNKVERSGKGLESWLQKQGFTKQQKKQ